MSDEERLAPEVGEKEAVALIRGCTQVERVESELRVVRKVVQPVVMLLGMRVEF
jgi:hypothetical protein